MAAAAARRNAEQDSQLDRQLALLRQHRKSIVADLDVQDVIPELLHNLVILHDDKQRIDSEKTLEDKANELINILEKKTAQSRNSEVLSVFVRALKIKYAWLYAKLAEDVPDYKIPNPVGPPTQDKERERRQDNLSSSLLRNRNKLEVGGVPCLPLFTVERHDLLQMLCNELVVLKRNQYVVLQGMAGCGKSVLAIQACNTVLLQSDPTISHKLNDGIFWLSIGKECSEAKDAILAKMRILCDKLEETRAPNSLEHGAELLRSAFIKRPNSILILDDVWRPEVIRAFDVGCRTLVTTRDISVMDVVQGRINFIKVSDGFTEAEAMELFRQTVHLSSEATLPDTAKSIFLECKGSPMVCSLIGALLQDHDSMDEGRWNYYLDALSKRKYSKIRRNREYEHESIFDALALSIESLSEKTRDYYSDFALFQDDVGIPSAVLMTLWNLGKYDVEDIMKDLIRKNLAVGEYDAQRKSNIYSVHDLQLDYLKFQLQNEKHAEKELHSKLIDKYLSSSSHQFHKLPGDGYIHFYLGYHLYKAERFDDFPRAYLNFLFIGEKIRLSGPADLLIDLRKYQDYILRDDPDERSNYIDQLKTFAQLVGHRMYGQMDVDIVQLGLQTPNLHEIYSRARKLAKSSSHRLYLEWKNASGSEWKNPESTVLCGDNVRCVKFLGSQGNYFLAGLNNGYIELCDMRSSAVCHIFSGHDSAVQSIDIFQWDSNPFLESGHAKFIFLSASDDKTCKLWDLRDVFENLEFKTNEIGPGDSPFPKFRPDRWTFEKPRDDSYLTFANHASSLKHAEFSRDGLKVVSTSTTEAMIWNAVTGELLSEISVVPPVENVDFQLSRFLYEDNGNYLPYLLSSAENRIMIFSVENLSNYSAIEGHHMRIISILLLTPSSFCTISENEIGLWRILHGKTPPKSRNLTPRKSHSAAIINGGNSFTKTQADALTFSAQTSEDQVRRPSDFQNPFASESTSGADSAGRKSPTLSSDCYSPSYVSTVLECGQNFIKLVREEVLPRRSSGLFQCAALSEDELLACGTSERKIVLWKLDERSYLGEFSSHNGWLRSLDFSTVDHWCLLSGSEDRTVMVWDVEEEQRFPKQTLKRKFFASIFVQSQEINDPGQFLSIFATNANTAQIYRDSKKLAESVALPATITAVTLSNCGTHGVIGTSDGRIYRLKDMQATLRSSLPKAAAENNSITEAGFDFVGSLENSIAFLKFNSDGLYLVAGSSMGNTATFKEFRLHRQTDFQMIVNCHFLHDKSLISVCNNRMILMVQHVESGKHLEGFQSENITGVTCSVKKLDSSAIVVGTNEDGVFLCTIDEKRGVVDVTAINCRHNTAVRSLAFSNDGLKLAIGHDNGLITIWNLNGGVFIEEADLILHKSAVRFLLFSPMFVGAGRWLVSCGDQLAFWTLSKTEDKLPRPTFMEERRRRKSGESRPPSRLSLDLSEGSKIGRQGKRELLQTFWFHGLLADMVVSNTSFSEFITVDDTGVLYVIETLKGTNELA